ncbi:TPA: hypothetical protein N0F65_005245 [Lagenidium giganteum]|uniref:LAGLIDADG endonuclease n=1 Tax=Lagenidium giganteum TaxID=4803 RepID=A0AAV2YXG0_9STRA|nr:TPA: hypothetical protein N0F65_005245 [Lagenidium giganteum]
MRKIPLQRYFIRYNKSFCAGEANTCDFMAMRHACKALGLAGVITDEAIASYIAPGEPNYDIDHTKGLTWKQMRGFLITIKVPVDIANFKNLKAKGENKLNALLSLFREEGIYIAGGSNINGTKQESRSYRTDQIKGHLTRCHPEKWCVYQAVTDDSVKLTFFTVSDMHAFVRGESCALEVSAAAAQLAVELLNKGVVRNSTPSDAQDGASVSSDARDVAVNVANNEAMNAVSVEEKDDLTDAEVRELFREADKVVAIEHFVLELMEVKQVVIERNGRRRTPTTPQEFADIDEEEFKALIQGRHKSRLTAHFGKDICHDLWNQRRRLREL